MESRTKIENQEQQAIEKALNKYFDSLNQSDLNIAVASYTLDGVFIAPGAPTAIGSTQLKSAYEFLFKNIQLSVKVTFDEVIIRDDFSFVRTHSQGTTLIHATGETVPAENREVFLLQKEQGEWKIARYIFNQPT